MADHKKPTKAELQAEADKALQELQEPEVITEPQEPIAEEQPEEVVEEQPEVITEPQEEQQEVEEEIQPEKEEIKQQEIDYKKRYADSTREAQILHAKNKQLNDAIAEASLLPDPTEEELIKEYPDWDIMTDTEKRLAKDSLISTKRFAIIHEESQKFKKVEEWNEKVDQFTQDPKILVDNPELDGKLDEFKLFASKQSRVGVDFNDLVSAFLYSVEKEKAKIAPKKGQMFEQPTGGNMKPKPKNNMLSVEEGQMLMKTDYNKFKEYLKAGRIQLPN